MLLVQTREKNERIRTDNHDIELETTLEKLLLNLGGDRVKTNVALEDGLNCRRKHMGGNAGSVTNSSKSGHHIHMHEHGRGRERYPPSELHGQ